ncbi:pilus assembly protein TadB [Sphingorhabdus lutea]|uniref:Pilus assembly protein TadB n=1 Tax=Sphingorhabdus lutea TaxID=1913578 RepID=A0A1L3JCY2_9SPHN|nr:type II secretion system F family protein [Sphingorhabdus lutea]APG63001.1 pilus assembly protein TadB [Sphingorhabdus lutea]
MNSQLTIFLTLSGVLGFIVLAFLAFNDGAGKTVAKRINAIRVRHSDSSDVKVEQQMRKAIAARRPINASDISQLSRSDKLRLRLTQTGKRWEIKNYLIACASIAAVFFMLLFLKGAPLLLAVFVGISLGLALPHMFVGHLINKRIKNFTSSFPDAIELLVRGLKSGLPVGETLGVVGREVDGPVGEEFKMVTEKIKIGKTMEDALQESADRLDTPEFQFFVITLAIQRETGGNLAETLANLANVLRSRAQMKLKIRAMSSESKASAYIVGSLPFLVFAMVWYVNPDYLGGFFYEERLIIAGIIGLVWMGIGVAIMAKMVSFEI